MANLFVYFLLAIITISVIVGIIFIFQHVNLTNNQVHIMENQVLLKSLLNKVTEHEKREEVNLFNSSDTNVNISLSNSQKLNKLLDYFNLTK